MSHAIRACALAAAADCGEPVPDCACLVLAVGAHPISASGCRMAAAGLAVCNPINAIKAVAGKRISVSIIHMDANGNTGKFHEECHIIFIGYQ
ncbi:hypothetical protein ACQKE8_17560 [Sphingobium limneticum]|jgi:hypothetical protein|uniref:hypothetical protein n=1 Tax=Sphingobium limneticum TaxID=1007511 RepID=UPI003D065908